MVEGTLCVHAPNFHDQYLELRKCGRTHILGVCVCLRFSEIAKVFAKVIAAFYTSQQYMRVLLVLYTHYHLLLERSLFLILGIPVDM